MTVLFYLIPTIPLVVGIILWLTNRHIAWWEVLVSAGIAFSTAGIIHGISVANITADEETWSGRVVEVVYQPPWEEYYEQAIYRTEYYTVTVSDGKGGTKTETRTRQVFSHWESRYRDHPERWWANTDVRGQEYIHKEEFLTWSKAWGGTKSRKGVRYTGEHNSRLHSGDPNDYYAVSTGDPLWPVTVNKRWQNRLKASPSVFDFQEISPEQAGQMGLYEWPQTTSWRQSNRVLGVNNMVDIKLWDDMNTRLNPRKQCNVILVGFGSKPMSTGLDQRAYWHGGKKNDIVITHGDNWVKSWGWSYENTVFSKLDTAVLLNKEQNNGKVTKDVIPEIEQVIEDHYQRKQWADFNYITVSIPTWGFVTQIIVTMVVQCGWFWFALRNDFDNVLLHRKQSRRC
jgi:hypothetical protein